LGERTVEWKATLKASQKGSFWVGLMETVRVVDLVDLLDVKLAMWKVVYSERFSAEVKVEKSVFLKVG
jgi:hypothetical protein